jgi:hypothetical protein
MCFAFAAGREALVAAMQPLLRLETERIGEERSTRRFIQRDGRNVLGHTVATDRGGHGSQQDEPNTDSSHDL